MRGYGLPQVAFACESQMDIVANELGMDPLELRMRNGVVDGSKVVYRATALCGRAEGVL